MSTFNPSVAYRPATWYLRLWQGPATTLTSQHNSPAPTLHQRPDAYVVSLPHAHQPVATSSKTSKPSRERPSLKPTATPPECLAVLAVDKRTSVEQHSAGGPWTCTLRAMDRTAFGSFAIVCFTPQMRSRSYFRVPLAPLSCPWYPCLDPAAEVGLVWVTTAGTSNRSCCSQVLAIARKLQEPTNTRRTGQRRSHALP